MGRPGTGTTITFGTSSFSAELLDVDHDEISRESIDTTHMGSASKTSRPGKLMDPAGFTMEIAFDPDEQPPIEGEPETITIQFPTDTGESVGAKVEGTGYVSGWKFGASLEERMTATVSVKWSAKPTWTDATGS